MSRLDGLPLTVPVTAPPLVGAFLSANAVVEGPGLFVSLLLLLYFIHALVNESHHKPVALNAVLPAQHRQEYSLAVHKDFEQVRIRCENRLLLMQNRIPFLLQ